MNVATDKARIIAYVEPEIKELAEKFAALDEQQSLSHCIALLRRCAVEKARVEGCIS